MVATPRALAALSAVAVTSAWSSVFAKDDITDCGILAGVGADCKNKLRNGNVSFDDIPAIIQTATSILLGLTGTISMLMVILGGFKYALGSVEGDKTKGKEAVIYGIAGFAVSALAWFIVKLVLDNL